MVVLVPASPSQAEWYASQQVVGYWHSKDSITSQTEAEAIVSGFNSRGIHIDVLVLDSQYKSCDGCKQFESMSSFGDVEFSSFSLAATAIEQALRLTLKLSQIQRQWLTSSSAMARMSWPTSTSSRTSHTQPSTEGPSFSRTGGSPCSAARMANLYLCVGVEEDICSLGSHCLQMTTTTTLVPSPFSLSENNHRRMTATARKNHQ